jgi:predicted RNase H-like HicB family nuclease
MRKYLILVEKAEANLSAYSPDLPGCAATGATLDETLANMRAAIALHVEGLREDGQPIPEPSTIAEYIEVAS